MTESKWEYDIQPVSKLNYDSLGDRAKWLDTRGDEGWELVSVSPLNDRGDAYYFKRPILPPPQSTN